jgi:hypothetical protein
LTGRSFFIAVVMAGRSPAIHAAPTRAMRVSQCQRLVTRKRYPGTIKALRPLALS